MIWEDAFGAYDARHSMAPEREWLLAADELPPVAAHVVTSRTGYTHHGIYVGEGKVVHYAGLSRGWKPGPIEEVSLAEFSRGRPVRVRTHVKTRFDRSDVVARARSRLGEDCYRILSNNCEHFCEWCVCGESRSRQVELLRMQLGCTVRAALRVVGRFADCQATCRTSASLVTSETRSFPSEIIRCRRSRRIPIEGDRQYPVLRSTGDQAMKVSTASMQPSPARGAPVLVDA